MLFRSAVMFLWLLVFNQWRRLLPLYLPTGLLLFAAIAVPWHVLAAQRNPQWAQFYFVHEHWERFTTTAHGRAEPWWYFGPVLLAGFFPWTGFLWPVLRERLKGGWTAARGANADAWFLALWAGFILLFFSKSQSKLIPYILPVFPPLAVLLGAWLAGIVAGQSTERLRWPLRIFGFFAGILGAALLIAALRPGTIRPEEIRLAVRDNAIPGAVILITGGVASVWFSRNRGVREALAAVAVTAAGFYAAVATAQDDFARSDTRSLAAYTMARIQPGDRIYHYRGFFHDFVFYARREVGTVAWKDELEIDIDPAAPASGRFVDEPEFRRQWAGPQRLWVVARREEAEPLFRDASFQFQLLAETRNHVLFSNRP
mgnify:FL=1